MKTFETERLIIRGWQLDDLDDLYEYAKNSNVGPMAGWEPHSNKDVSLNVLKLFIENDETWAIVSKEDGNVIGSLRIYPDENRGKYNVKYISFVLSASYWGKGYMTEAVNRVVKYAFEEMDIDMLSVFHYPHNIRSKRVIEKCGFQYEVTIRQTSQRYDGKIFDTVCYSMLKSEYFSE